MLLLNTCLTVRSGAAASHQGKGWETFTDEVLRTVNAKPHRVVFILWGAHARKKKALIDTTRHTVIESAHPSPLSAHNGFFGSRPFSRTNAALVEAGFDWRFSCWSVTAEYVNRHNNESEFRVMVNLLGVGQVGSSARAGF